MNKLALFLLAVDMLSISSEYLCVEHLFDVLRHLRITGNSDD
jgi:hypothetical protein